MATLKVSLVSGPELYSFSDLANLLKVFVLV